LLLILIIAVCHHCYSCSFGHASALENHGFELAQSDSPPDDPELNFWVIKNLTHSGLVPSGVDEVNTYFRKASYSLFEKLTVTAGNIWVSGPPGVGKSLTIFGWLINQTRRDQSVLWVHCTGAGASTAKMMLAGV
jgi:hypothetical protein